jgi:hypothetical protein
MVKNIKTEGEEEMYQIKGKIQGTSDMLFNKMTAADEDNLRNGTSGGRFTDEERTAQAMEKYHTDDDGKAIINNWMFKQVLSNGSKIGNIKEKNKSMASLIIATVFVDGKIYLNPSTFDHIDVQWGRRPPRTGPACLIKRPLFKTGWTAEFMLNVLDDRRDANNIRRSLEEAGLLVGIGSHRPEYGRFIVTDWNVI